MFTVGIASERVSSRALIEVRDLLDILRAPDRREFKNCNDTDYIAFAFDDELKAEKFRSRFDGTHLPNAIGEWWKDLD